MKIVLCGLLSLMATLSGFGCARGGGGDLTIRSTTIPNALLRGGFERGYYRVEDDNRVTMILYDGSVQAPDQVVTLRMMWRPRAGRTPVESTATNVTIHYVIFAGVDRGEVGIYAGGGFLYPHNRIGDQTLNVGLWESSLQITHATPQFVDRLGQAVAQGRIRVTRDDVGVPARLRDVNLAIRERLGYTRMVDALLPGAEHPGEHAAPAVEPDPVRRVADARREPSHPG